MKLDLIISEALILFEGVKVGAAAIKRAIASADEKLQMGFEVEFVPSGGGSGEDVSLTDLDLNDLDNYFYNTSFDNNALIEYLYDHEEEFFNRGELEEEFMDDHFRRNRNWYEDWLDENGYRDEDDPTPDDELPDEDEVKDSIKEELEDEIQEYVQEHTDNIEYSDIAENWFKDDPFNFIQAMGWELEYGYEFDDYGDITHMAGASTEDVATELEQMVHDPVEAFDGYHDSAKQLDTWYVETDSSVDNGIEISSPVKPVTDSILDLEMIFKWMEEMEYETNDETGLHVSLSYLNHGDEENDEKIDWVKMAVLMGEEHALEEFERLGNTYTASHMQRIKTFIKNEDIEGLNSSEAYNKLKQGLGKEIRGRESSFNITKYETTGRIEFRIMGNEDYHKDFDKVKNGIGRYIMFLEIAKSPTLYKKQYLTKLGKLLTSKGSDDLKNTESHMKDLDTNSKKWIRALSSAFGSLSDNAVGMTQNLLQSINIANQNEDSDIARSNVRKFFFSLLTYDLVNPAINIMKSDMNNMVAESIRFITYLIEAKKTSKLERMKMITRKLAKFAGIDNKDFTYRFGMEPDHAVQQIRPEDGKIEAAGAIALLVFPDVETTFDELLNNRKPIMKLANKFKQELTRTLFLDLIKQFEMSNLKNYSIDGTLRNLIYFIQDDPIKEDANLKNIIKDWIIKAEHSNIDVMRSINQNRPGLDNQKEAIQYVYTLMGREHPDVAAKKKKEMEQKERDRYNRERAVLRPPRQQQQPEYRVAAYRDQPSSE